MPSGRIGRFLLKARLNVDGEMVYNATKLPTIISTSEVGNTARKG